MSGITLQQKVWHKKKKTYPKTTFASFSKHFLHFLLFFIISFLKSSLLQNLFLRIVSAWNIHQCYKEMVSGVKHILKNNELNKK